MHYELAVRATGADEELEGVFVAGVNVVVVRVDVADALVVDVTDVDEFPDDDVLAVVAVLWPGRARPR